MMDEAYELTWRYADGSSSEGQDTGKLRVYTSPDGAFEGTAYSIHLLRPRECGLVPHTLYGEAFVFGHPWREIQRVPDAVLAAVTNFAEDIFEAETVRIERRFETENDG